MTTSARAIVWLAGVGWDQITGTDKRIVQQIGLRRPVVWIDPPVSMGRRPSLPGSAMPEVVLPGVSRVRVTALPGVTRPGIRAATAMMVDAAVRTALAGLDDATVVVAHPYARFPRGISATQILYLTDDWIDGAPLMGLSREHIVEVLRSNLAAADAVAAVTPSLLDVATAHQQPRSGVPQRVIANGAPEPTAAGGSREAVAGLVGQINERLDLALLESLADRGVSVRIIGPRADRDEAFGRRFESLLTRPTVEWTGPVPSAELPAQLARLGVGLTPYLDSPFNRASFPLKTLEYLSAGLPVASSDLPASRWIDSEHVKVYASAAEFVDGVVGMLAARPDPLRDAERRALAASHGWDRRADEFLELIDAARGG